MFLSAFVYVRQNTDLDLVVNTELIFALRPGILVTWSPENTDVGIRASLIQIYPILLSTLLSINRQTLDLFDASTALLLTSSPLTVYLVVASICGLFGFETDLYKGTQFHRRTFYILGALVLPLWLGLSMTLSLSGRAFVWSMYCRGSTFKDWLSELFQSLESSSPFWPVYLDWRIGVLPAFALTFGLCLFRRRSRLMESFQADMEGASKVRGTLRIPWSLLKCAWCVCLIVALSQPSLMPPRRTVSNNHGWCTGCLFMYLDYNWAYHVIGSARNALVGGYALSYGQVSLLLCSGTGRILTESPLI